jgi:hypothetical protein
MGIALEDRLSRGLYRLRLLKPWKVWAAGELVDVYPNIAERLIIDGYADLIRRGSDQPKETSDDDSTRSMARPTAGQRRERRVSTSKG